MQDHRYNELRQMLGANAEKGIDERIKELMQNPTEPRWEDLEEEVGREHLREDLQPKYVIVDHGDRYEFRASYVDMHRSLLSSDEIRHGLCDGGGFWGVNGEKQWVTLYDSSSDFGYPKHLHEAIRQDGSRLLEILGRVCDKSGQQHDLSGYTITFMDRQHERHIVKPPYNKEPQVERFREWDDVPQKRLSHEDYERFELCRNYTPPSPVNKKKRKAKAKAQKQSRRKNRKH